MAMDKFFNSEAIRDEKACKREICWKNPQSIDDAPTVVLMPKFWEMSYD
jgi:hypothetical protein